MHRHDNECDSFPHGKESDLIVEIRYNRDKTISKLIVELIITHVDGRGDLGHGKVVDRGLA